MHPIRKQRLQLVILLVVAASAIVGLMAYMLGQNANYFYTPSQIAAGEAVVEGSVQRSPDSLDVLFDVSDGMATLTIHFAGILPDLFDEGEAAIASGKLDENNILRATEVLAKHDEKYTPPEVADAMNKAYELKQQEQAQ